MFFGDDSDHVDAFLGDLVEARASAPLSVEEKEANKALLLDTFGSDDGTLQFSALEVLMSVEDCFLLKFKAKSRITSVDFMHIWAHYDENGDGEIHQAELHGLLRDLLLTGAKRDGAIVTPASVQEYSEVIMTMFDADHDGSISVGELSKILAVEKNYLRHLQGRTSLTKEQFAKVWNHYDREKTGTITGPSLQAFTWDEIRHEVDRVETVSGWPNRVERG
jgi:Ca2+-binding EF-hand superfamily protein